MNIAIVGSSGYISGFLLKKLADDPAIDRIFKIDKLVAEDIRYLDLEKPEFFRDTSLKGIDYMIFSAAISSPDQCAKEFDRCWQVNVTGTSNIISRAIAAGIRVLFFSSDAVFGADAGTAFDEQSETHAITPYGRMKKAVEDKFKHEKNFKVIRLSYVASASDRFVTYCLKCIKNNEVAEIFHPFYRNCITVNTVCSVVLWMLKNWDMYDPFVLNVAGKELISRVRIADEVNRFFNNRLKYKVITPEKEFFNNRPAITQITSNYLYSRRIIENKSFSEYIRKELENVKL